MVYCKKFAFVLLFAFIASIGFASAGGVVPDLYWTDHDFVVYESTSLTPGAGTEVCSLTLTNTDNQVVTCDSGTIEDDTEYCLEYEVSAYADGSQYEEKWDMGSGEDPSATGYFNIVGVMGSGNIFGSGATVDSCDWIKYDAEYKNDPQCTAFIHSSETDTIQFYVDDVGGDDEIKLKDTNNEDKFGMRICLTSGTGTTSDSSTYLYTIGDKGASERSNNISFSVVPPNAAPTIIDIIASHSLIKGGETITIYANTTSNGVNDSDADELFLYCDSTATPTSANTDCTGGTLNDTTYPYVLTCTFAVPTDDTSHTEYCRVYDGTNYSSVVPNVTYTTDSTNPLVDFVLPTTETGSYKQDWVVANVSASDTNIDSILIRLFNSTGLFNYFIGNYFNFTGLVDGFYYLNATANDSVGNENSTETQTIILDNEAPSVLFNFQDPDDVDTFNIFGRLLNISYNISDNIKLNVSSVQLYYKTNSSTGGGSIYTNGTADYYGFETEHVDITNDSDVWYFKLDDSAVYPATYNFDELVMETMMHSSYELDGGRDMMKVRLFNVSNVKEYSILEIMISNNEVGGDKDLRIYYCNSSYVSGKPKDSDYCVNFYNMPAQTEYNHVHSVYSAHQTIPFGMNITTGFIYDVYVTNTSYFIFRGEGKKNSYDIYYIDNISQEDTIQLSTNEGDSWSDFGGTVDAHLHQYDGTDAFNYYTCANDSVNNENCSDVRTDVFDLTDLPPTAPDVYSPVEGSYNGDVVINYTASITFNGNAISFYNISLTDENDTFVQDIKSNNSLNLSYVWDSTEAVDGWYEIRVEACDNESRCSFGYADNITIDNTAPGLEIVSPLNSSYTDNEILVNISSDGTSVWYNWNGTNVTYSGEVNVAFNEGVNILYAWANDSLGNLNSTNVTFFVDSVAPLIEFVEPTTNTTNCSRDWIAANVSVVEDNLDSVTVYLYNSSGLVNFSNDLFVNFTDLADDTYYLNATANDTLGNVNITETRMIKIDTVPPTIDIVSPESAAYTDDEILVNITSDGDSVWYNWNGTNVSYAGEVNVTFDEELNILHVWANDSCGNVNYTNVTFYVDTIVPTLEIVSPESKAYTDDEILVNITSNGTNVWYNWNGTNATYASEVNVTFNEGLNILHAWANDSSGNVNYTNVTFYVDTIVPTLEIVSPLNQSYGNATVLVNLSSDGDNVWYNWDGTNVSYVSEVNVTFDEGVNVLYAWANDSSGNVNYTNVTFYVDSIAPLIEFVEPTTNTTNCSRNWIFGNVTASDLNLDTTVIYLYNSSGLVNSSIGTFANFTNLADGTYYLNSTANDSLGNENSTETRTVQIDTIPPTIYIHSPLNQTYDEDGVVLVNLSHDGDNIWYNWNGTNVTYSSEINVTFNEGVNTLVVYANDSCGNTNSSNVTFTVDITAPSLEIISPLNQSYNNATVLVNVSSDGDNIWYNWNGTNVTYSSEINVTFNEGSNTLVAYANDNVGNLNSTNITFTIDTTAPAIEFVAPTTTGNVSQDYIVGNVSAVDVNLDTVTVYLYSDSGLVNSSIGTFVNFTDLVDRTYYLNSTANDSFGNLNSTETRAIILDTTSPSISIISPLNQSYTNATVLVNISSDGDDVWYNWDGTNVSYSSGVNVTFAEGVNVLYAYANDTFGNLNVSNVTFVVDTTAPLIEFVAPTTAAGNYSQDYIVANVTVSDLNLDTTVIYLYNSSGLVNSSIETFANFTNLADGTYYLNSTANDTFANSNSTETLTIVLDTTAPMIEFVEPTTNATNCSVEDIVANVSVSDLNLDTIVIYLYNSSGLVNSAVGTFANFTNLSDGTYYLNATANDTFGNVNSTETRLIVIRKAFPLINIHSPLGQNYSEDEILVNLSSDGEAVWYNWNGTNVSYSGEVNVTFNQGVNVLVVYANDSCGKVNSTNVSFTIDSVNPLIEFVAPTTVNGSYALDYIIGNVGVSDLNLDTTIIYLYNLSGLVNSTIGTSVNFTGLDDGVYRLNATANDTFGNVNSTETRFIYLDNAAPMIEFVAPTTTGNVSQDYIVANVSAIDVLLDSVMIYLYNLSGLVNSTNETFVNFTDLTDGTYYLNASANDSLGNENATETLTIILDTVAPNVTVHSPLNQSYGNGSVLINVSSDGVSVWYNWNGTNVMYTVPVNVTFAEGSNTLVVYANDSFGNVQSTSITFIVDFDGPVVELISPINGTMLISSSTVSFNYNVTDLSKVENCSLIVNDAFKSSDTSIVKNVTQTFAVGLTNGDYNWSVNCTDNATNENFSETENFSLSYVAPVTPPTTGGGGGGGGGSIAECYDDTGCAVGQYCLEKICYDDECNSDSDCNDTKTCWMGRCLKLFDMKIEDVESPIFPGESFGFTYFLKGVAAIHGDVVVKFWLENSEGEVVTEGFDTIYMADFEEKTESTELFLPATIAPGTYNFYAEVNYDSYYARALRVIDVGGELDEAEDTGFLTGQTVLNVGEVIRTNAYFLLFVLGILVLAGIIYWERKDIRKALEPESRWIRRHKLSIGTFLFFVVLAGVLFYADRAGVLKLSPFNMSLVKFLYIAGLVAALAVVLARARIRNMLGHFVRVVKSLFARKENVEIEPMKFKRVKPEVVKVKPKIVPVKPVAVKKVKVKPKVVKPRAKKVKPGVRKPRAKKIKSKIVSVKPKVAKVEPVKKKVVHRKKRAPRVKSLLEKSHPKLYEELKLPGAKLVPTKTKVVRKSQKLDREMERARAMRDKVSNVGKKRVAKSNHSDLKKELKEIKSGKVKSSGVSTEEKELLRKSAGAPKKDYVDFEEDIKKIKSGMSRSK